MSQLNSSDNLVRLLTQVNDSYSGWKNLFVDHFLDQVDTIFKQEVGASNISDIAMMVDEHIENETIKSELLLNLIRGFSTSVSESIASIK